MHNIYADVRLQGLQGLQATWKRRWRRKVIQFFKPPASRKNKHADTSLNMPRGSYHIQLSNGGVGGDTSSRDHPLTSPRLSDPSDKTSDKLEGLRVHASCLNVQGGGKKKCLFYTVWREKQTLAVLLVILLPACVCIRRCLCSGRPFRGDAFVRRCCQTHF